MLNPGFTFNGQHSADFFIVNNINRAIAPQVTSKLLTVPERPGAYDNGRTIAVRQFKIDITIVKSIQSDYLTLLHSLTGWLVTDDPQVLVFDDEPDKTYMARLDGSSNLTETLALGQGSITFTCADPFAYGPEQTQTIIDPNTPANADSTIQNNGTQETKPKFTATILKSISFLSIATPDHYILLGSPATVEDTEVDENEEVYTDDMSSTANWTTGTYVDGGTNSGPGVVAGAMAAQNGAYVATDYGSGSGWHGPALVYTLTNPLTDFLIGVRLSQNDSSSDGSQMGRAEIYLFDANDNVVAKAALRDGHKDYELNQADFHVGSNQILFDGFGGALNNFSNGYIQIQRQNNHWQFDIGKVASDGSHYARDQEKYNDQDNLYGVDIAKIQLHLGQFSTYAATDQNFGQLNVTKLNSVGDYQVPIIAHVNDELVIDMDKRKILLNGADVRYLKDIRSSYFSLQPGINPLAVGPADGAKIDISYSERWL